MTDTFSAEQRSACMRSVKSKNTTPELTVRKAVHSMGYRYTLHGASLPGKPDLVFPSRRKVIFVHGCFWHNHGCRRGRRAPATNAKYWDAKRTRNAERDKVNTRMLRKQAWEVLILWECCTRNEKSMRKRLDKFLRPA